MCARLEGVRRERVLDAPRDDDDEDDDDAIVLCNRETIWKMRYLRNEAVCLKSPFSSRAVRPGQGSTSLSSQKEPSTWTASPSPPITSKM